MNVACGFMVLCLWGVLAGCGGQAALPPKAIVLNQAGAEALEQGDLAVAQARFSLALEFHPEFVEALANLGLVEMQRGNFVQAEVWLDKAVSINRHMAQPHHGLGLLEEHRNRRDRAVEHYREALRIDPGFVPARANLARLYFEAERIDDAREQYLRLVQVAPEDPHGWTGLADCLYRLGRDEQAMRVVQEAVALIGSEAPGLRIHFARILLQKGEMATARAQLGHVTGLSGPTGCEAWAWMALSFLMEASLEKALRCAEQALSMDRNHPLATYVLAMSLAQARDPSAIPWLARARARSPGNSVITEALDRLKSDNPK